MSSTSFFSRPSSKQLEDYKQRIDLLRQQIDPIKLVGLCRSNLVHARILRGHRRRFIAGAELSYIRSVVRRCLKGSSLFLPLCLVKANIGAILLLLSGYFHRAEISRTMHLPDLSTSARPDQRSLTLKSAWAALWLFGERERERATLTNELILFSGWSDISATTTPSERSDCQRTTAHFHSSTRDDDVVTLGIRGESASTDQSRTTWGDRCDRIATPRSLLSSPSQSCSAACSIRRR